MSLVHSDVDDDDAVCTAMSCMRAVNTVLHSLHKMPHLYAEVEPIVLPAIHAVFTAQAMDFFDDVLESMTCFTYYPKSISDAMWALFPHLLQAFHEYAYDYISSMIHPIDNYICIGTARFLATKEPNLLEGVMSMCHKILSDDYMEVEAQYAAKVAETLLSACRGQLDAYYSPLFRMICGKMVKCESLPLKFLLLNALASAAYYNPEMFLAECQATNSTADLINFWMSHCEKMTGAFQRKAAVLGLGSLCLVPMARQPPVLAGGMDKVLSMILTLLEEVEEDSEEGDDEDDAVDGFEEDEDEDDDDDDDRDPREDFNEVDEDEDAVDGQDVEYLKSLTDRVCCVVLVHFLVLVICILLLY
jgi:hypothetical protein